MKYQLTKSNEDPLWWVLVDTENQIVCRFKEGDFNKTQRFSGLNDVDTMADAEAMPTIAREMTDWLMDHHYEIIFTSPTQIKERTRKGLGAELRAAREDAGYSLRDVEKLTGIANNHILRIEQGRYNVSIDTLAVIADALNLEVGLFQPD